MKDFYMRLRGVIQTSEDPCYVYYDDVRCYPEMCRCIRKINSFLHGMRQKRIVLYAGKSFETYAALYAIILSENVWIPLNPETPADRAVDMLKTAMPDAVLFQTEPDKRIKSMLDGMDVPCVSLSGLIEGNNESEIREGDFPGDDTAYIMFTSGSTGKPKGVPVTHENYINFVENALEILPLGKGEIFSDLHDLGFDISIVYLFLSVMTNSAIAPAIKEGERFVPLDNLIRNKVTVLATVPSTLSLIRMLRPDGQVRTSLKIAFLCGEPFSTELYGYCAEKLDIPDIYNFYGLTETGVENFYHRCSKEYSALYEEKGFIPIGTPLNGNRIRISKDNELMIAGCQITPGYLGGIESERFVTIDGERWFYSGDIVEEKEGLIWCKGRKDHQVKIAGYRIELMDIEVNLRALDGVNDAVCFVKDVNGRNMLCCVIEANEPVDMNVLKDQLKKHLPTHMIPQSYMALDKFPRNRSGKIDRLAIKNLYLEKNP